MCMQILHVFKADNPPFYARDESRLRLVTYAAERQDWAYLTLHQYYCLMITSVQSLSPDIQRHQHLGIAHAILQESLDDNPPSQLSTPFLRFFRTFPAPVEQLASTWPASWQQAKRDFVAFVDHSPSIAQFLDICPLGGRDEADAELSSWGQGFEHIVSMLIRAQSQLGPKNPTSPHMQQQPQQRQLTRQQRAQQLYQQRLQEQQQQHQQQQQQQQQQQLQQQQQQLQQQQPPEQQLPEQQLYEQQLYEQLYEQLYPQQQPLQQLQQQHPQQQHLPQPQQQPFHPQAYSLPNNTPVVDMTRGPPPPRAALPRTASQASPPLQGTVTQAQPSQRPRNFTPLLPPPRTLLQQQRVPAPSRFSLHQAHLRSPLLHVSGTSSPCYCYWQGFAQKPTRLTHANTATEKISFNLSENQMLRIARPLPTAPGAADNKYIDELRKTVRLRCVKWTSSEEITNSAWAVTDNSWTPHSYFALNNTPLQLRKKIHHGKDLPVDLTALVQQGPNTLEVSVMSNSSDTTHCQYLVAVEFLGIVTEATIKTQCQERTIPAAQTLSAIKAKLSTDASADDLVIVESSLTISLLDPFTTAPIGATPVRSLVCRHND
ncbi:hypothetical protein OPT61_g10588 [Boeremia exigua]|uniref:Uncharacterized protein n=1 Tax=Boeremia exigua TaxID=749465 RepID=A0ACC2HP69_9PLEO|nr:hypothetical protein OPT61_g10588 [Boeremia exigua]